tara:strand:+ start:252 stop:860 length:609 start_codon:yes stop_codon:yes gene_type:complete
MLRKNLLHIFHQKQICNNSCVIKYPWGWKNLVNCNFIKNIKKPSISNLNEEQFMKDTLEPYNIIYKSYLNKIDFLDYQYTNPSLSIALNTLRGKLSDDNIINLPDKIKVKEISIIKNITKNDYFTCNNKFLGYFNKNEIMHEFTAGFIGPEIQHLWDLKPTKQIITVSYKSEDFFDIIDWERNLSVDEPSWQVSNINYIVKN